MLTAAKQLKDRHMDLYEDEMTSIIFGPLMYMPPEDVWTLFRAWLPFDDELWPAGVSDGMDLSFWPNLSPAGRIEPDLLVRFTKNGELFLTVMFEIKWNARISGHDELTKQWNALKDKEKANAFHVYLVKNTGIGIHEVTQSLEDSGSTTWRKRLVCIGWRSLVEILKFGNLPFGKAMNFWAEGLLAFLKRRGQTTFTGFEWLKREKVYRPATNRIFYKILPWFSKPEQTVQNCDTALFWQDR